MRLTLEIVASELRKIALSVPEGEMLGGEEALVGRLGASRATVRQAARLLEREGLLTVRRGFNGGYFAARPSMATVEAIASSYLQSIEVNSDHVGMIAMVLWIEVVREAAQLRTDAARKMADKWIARVDAFPPRMTLREISDFEQELRGAVFALINARYVELIFHINVMLGHRGAFDIEPSIDEPTSEAFVRNWKGAKRAELQAIMDGDAELAAMAARHSSNLLQNAF